MLLLFQVVTSLCSCFRLLIYTLVEKKHENDQHGNMLSLVSSLYFILSLYFYLLIIFSSVTLFKNIFFVLIYRVVLLKFLVFKFLCWSVQSNFYYRDKEIKLSNPATKSHVIRHQCTFASEFEGKSQSRTVNACQDASLQTSFLLLYKFCRVKTFFISNRCWFAAIVISFIVSWCRIFSVKLPNRFQAAKTTKRIPLHQSLIRLHPQHRCVQHHGEDPWGIPRGWSVSKVW